MAMAKGEAAPNEDKKPTRGRKPRAKKASGDKPAATEPAGPVNAPEGSVYIGQSGKAVIYFRLANRQG
jgi:hypothetical protein